MKRAIQEVKETKGIIRSRYRRRTDNTMDRKIILIKTAVLVKQEGPAYLSGTSEFIPGFSGVHVAQSLVASDVTPEPLSEVVE
jgi:hypothetical protein